MPLSWPDLARRASDRGRKYCRPSKKRNAPTRKHRSRSANIRSRKGQTRRGARTQRASRAGGWGAERGGDHRSGPGLAARSAPRHCRPTTGTSRTMERAKARLWIDASPEGAVAAWPRVESPSARKSRRARARRRQASGRTGQRGTRQRASGPPTSPKSPGPAAGSARSGEHERAPRERRRRISGADRARPAHRDGAEPGRQKGRTGSMEN